MLSENLQENGCRIHNIIDYGVFKLTMFQSLATIKDLAQSDKNLKLMVYMITEKNQFCLDKWL